MLFAMEILYGNETNISKTEHYTKLRNKPARRHSGINQRHLIVSFPSIFTELCFLQKKSAIFCFAMQFMTSIDGQASGIPMRGQDQDINFVFS